MLITTSRKPSKRTRSFCQYLNRVLNSEYINRGKMSMRDVLLKSANLGYSYVAVVFEYNGNPSRIVFFNKEGMEIFSMTISVALPENRINIQKDELSFKCDLKELSILEDVFLESDDKPLDVSKMNKLDFDDFLSDESNFIWIKDSDNEEDNHKAVLEVFDKKGNCTGFKIFIKNFKSGS